MVSSELSQSPFWCAIGNGERPKNEESQDDRIVHWEISLRVTQPTEQAKCAIISRCPCKANREFTFMNVGPANCICFTRNAYHQRAPQRSPSVLSRTRPTRSMGDVTRTGIKIAHRCTNLRAVSRGSHIRLCIKLMTRSFVGISAIRGIGAKMLWSNTSFFGMQPRPLDATARSYIRA